MNWVQHAQLTNEAVQDALFCLGTWNLLARGRYRLAPAAHAALCPEGV